MLRGLARRLVKNDPSPEDYLRDTGAYDVLVQGDSAEIPPQLDDLANLHRCISERKAHIVVEFGVGYSTLVIAHALMQLEKQTGKPAQCHSVETNAKWLDNTRAKLPADLSRFVTFHQTRQEARIYNGTLCAVSETLPNVAPHLIYLDGPDARDIDGSVQGIGFVLECGGTRSPILADPLIYESTAPKNFTIVVDGRSKNVSFLRNNLQGDYRMTQSPSGQTVLVRRGL